jgi:hypothetical protein
MRTRTLFTTAALTAAMLIPVGAPPAVAGDNDVRRSGSCSRNSDWKLKLSPEDGRLEVEFEVDQNVVGARWRVTMKHDGRRFFRGRRVTRGPSGSFEVRRVVDNHRGRDRFTARARNLRSGELCRGSASI